MHDKLLNSLQAVADVSLVAGVADQRLGYPDKDHLRVFIPDLHLISDARQKQGHFRFVTNHEKLLTHLLGALRKLRLATKAPEKLSVLQLGDVLDLWREVPFIRPTSDTPARIANDHADLMNALRDPDLNATILFGNHDFELYHWASYDRNVRHIFIPHDNPQVMIVHGDVFDWLERLPDWIQDIAVYLFAPNVQPTTYALDKMHEATVRTTPNPTYVDYIKCRAPAPVGTVASLSDQQLPRFPFNVQQAGTPGAQVELYETAVKAMKYVQKEHNLDVRTVVIGHTHHARIVMREENQHLFTLIDCGAWIEKCVNDAGVVESSAQIGVLCGNEARIYQLRPRAE